MMENKVTKDMLVGKICAEHPEAIPALLGVGMHCLGCPSSQMESLQDAAFVHGRQYHQGFYSRLTSRFYQVIILQI